MTNSKLLYDKIKEKGLKIGFIVEKLGTSYSWFKKKADGLVAFKAYEIQILCEILDITDHEEKEAIFFAIDVENSST